MATFLVILSIFYSVIALFILCALILDFICFCISSNPDCRSMDDLFREAISKSKDVKIEAYRELHNINLIKL
jgi:hypothetical protein